MPDISEQLFETLQKLDDLERLIGQPEDAHFDCKEWPTKDDDAQRMLAKAACGLTNSEGGVLIIGLRAESKPKDQADVVSAIVPVDDTSLVKSRVLSLIGELVEPRIIGIRATVIPTPQPASKGGVVVILVPSTQGPPCRSRKDWKFYQRIGSGTFPMEYFQIEERFGKRPHPKLELFLEAEQKITVNPHDGRTPVRRVILGVTNSGAGLARFPSIRFRRSLGLTVDSLGIDGSGGFGLPLRPSETEWICFRGGVDDVIYQNETRKITKLWQWGENKGIEGIPTSIMPYKNNIIIKNRSVFRALDSSFEISCDGTTSHTFKYGIPEFSSVIDV